MKNIVFALIILLAILGFSSCYYDKADLLYPPANNKCDTLLPISYSLQIVPLFRQQCQPCHTQASPDGGIILGIYASDKIIAMNGKLYGSVNHAPGYSAMPKGKVKMTTCQVTTIKKWIDAGAPNN